MNEQSVMTRGPILTPRKNKSEDLDDERPAKKDSHVLATLLIVLLAAFVIAGSFWIFTSLFIDPVGTITRFVQLVIPFS
jgi:hypothetical protein